MSPDLLYRFNMGEEKAFEEVYRSHSGIAWSIALPFNKISYEDKQDAVINSFVKLFNFINRGGRFESNKHIKDYLCLAVKSECINKLRNPYYRNCDPLVNNEVVDIPESSTVVEWELIHELYILIESLPVQCRCIFKMLFIEELTVPEVAQRLDLEPQTIRNQKTRAINLLRKRIQYAL